MRNPSRRAVLVGSSSILALAATPLRRARSQGVLKIGVLYPFSGLQSDNGRECRAGTEVAPEVLRAHGYPEFELVYGDTESKVDVAQTAAQKLIDGGVHILVGSFHSGQTAAVAQVCEARGVPYVVSIAAVPNLTEQGYKTLFRNFPTATKTTTDSFAQLKKLFAMTGIAPKTASILHVNDTLGEARKKAIIALTTRLGMPYRVIESVGYDPTARDLSAEVRRVKSAGAELLLVVSRPHDAKSICKELVKQRHEPTGIVSLSSGWYERSFMRELGKYAEDAMSAVAWYNPRKPLAKTLRRVLEQRHSDLALNTTSAYAFEGIHIAVDAYRRAGGTEAGKLIEALRATKITGHVSTSPEISFAPNGQNENGGASLIQNKNGQNAVILPKDVADAEPIWPMRPWSARG